MPFEPFRTYNQPVNLADLNRFDDGAEVSPDTLRARGIATRKETPVKILARGDLERKNLVVSAHSFSAKAREAIEAAGGTCTVIEPKQPWRRSKS
jgi:large subunit ribosomal protein L15